MGCVVGFVLLGVAFDAIMSSNGSPLRANYLYLVILSIVLSIVGMLGDLTFSVVKRQYGIKDYGKIMPGHGGVMDRFDSWIFVAPILYLWNIYFPFIF